jgi:hypothetical protein
VTIPYGLVALSVVEARSSRSDETGRGILVSLDDALRSSELQKRLTPNAKRQFKRVKDKLRAAGLLYEMPDAGRNPRDDTEHQLVDKSSSRPKTQGGHQP